MFLYGFCQGFLVFSVFFVWVLLGFSMDFCGGCMDFGRVF